MNRKLRRWLPGLAALVVAVGLVAAVYHVSTAPNPPPATAPAVVEADDNDTISTATQLAGGWDDRFVRYKDPTSGASFLYLSGRFVLSDPNAAKQGRAQGTLIIELYDPKVSKGSDPKHLAEWSYEPATVAVLGRSGKEGFVVPIQLSWDAYTPEMEAVKLVVRFKQADGPELKQETNVTLDRAAVPTGDK